MDGFLFALTLFAALGCGVVAGVFFAYSAFMMRALARLPAQQGIAAMQAINVAAVTPVFMAALFGTALACGGLIVSSLLVWGEPFAAYLFIGGALYLAGARGRLRGSLELLERRADGVLVDGVPCPHRRLPLARGPQLAVRGSNARGIPRVPGSKPAS
jgi:hypothetical protein